MSERVQIIAGNVGGDAENVRVFYIEDYDILFDKISVITEIINNPSPLVSGERNITKTQKYYIDNTMFDWIVINDLPTKGIICIGHHNCR